MKKFNFNLKFLDRFKKSKAPETQEELQENLQDESQEELQEDSQFDESTKNINKAQFDRMPEENNEENNEDNNEDNQDENFDDLGEIKDSDLEKIHDQQTKSLSSTKIPTEEFAFKDENPEDFAEQTLNDFNIKKFRDQNSQLVNDTINENKTDSNMSFQELEPPEKPKVSSKFKIRFPSFKNTFSKENLKNSLSKKKAMEKLDKLSWDDFILRFFSPYSRGKIHGIFIIALVIITTYLLGKNVALFISRSAPITTNAKSSVNTPIEKADTASQDINRIASTNLFNVKESDKVEDKKITKDISNIICDDAEKPTAEPIKLLDTIVLQDSVKSVASVQVRGGSDLLNVREGDQLNDSVEVSRINRMKVILKNLSSGECEYVASEEEDVPLMTNMKILSPKAGSKLFKSNNPSIKNVGNSFKIKRQFRDSMINNMSEVLTQAKAIQINNPDGSLAFKMTEVVPGSIYSQLNIQNDDIITSINGKKIENLNELMTLLGRIKEIDQFQIGRKRNGQDENLEFGFE